MFWPDQEQRTVLVLETTCWPWQFIPLAQTIAVQVVPCPSFDCPGHDRCRRHVGTSPRSWDTCTVKVLVDAPFRPATWCLQTCWDVAALSLVFFKIGSGWQRAIASIGSYRQLQNHWCQRSPTAHDVTTKETRDTSCGWLGSKFLGSVGLHGSPCRERCRNEKANGFSTSAALYLGRCDSDVLENRTRQFTTIKHKPNN